MATPGPRVIFWVLGSFRRLLIPGFALLSLACSSDSAKSRYVLAEKLWSDGKYGAAVAEFERVMAKDPRGKLGLQATFRAAITETLYLGRHDSAVRKFRAFAESTADPDLSWEALKQAGEILYARTDQYESAIRHYTEMLRQRPDAVEAPEFQFRIGRSYFLTQQFDDALHSYQELQKKYPRTDWAERAAFETGVTLFTRGRTEGFQEAMDAYRKFIQRYPKSRYVPEAQFGIASCLEELDQLDAAYHQYEALLKSYPSPNVIRIKLVRIKERQAQKSR